ncbi:HD domain-containing protein [Desulfonauticus submarinus]
MDELKRLVDFFFEAGMLKKTPRSGYQFLGTGKENVAEHSFRTAIIGFSLARIVGADAYKTAIMCLFHDFSEARCGDFNYVNKIYNQARSRDALADALSGIHFSQEILELFDDLENVLSVEAILAHDADQLDLILNLKEELDLGNQYAKKWIDCAVKRLRSKEAKILATQIIKTDHTDWWFQIKDASWWEQKNGRKD